MDEQLLKKLQLKTGMSAAVVNSPSGFLVELHSAHGDGEISERVSPTIEWALLFVESQNDIERFGRGALETIGQEAIVWFAYPKKSSGKETDITRDQGWDLLNELGWKGVSMISVDETWSAFRVRPSEQTPANPNYPTSDEAVANKTGKNWAMWFLILEETGGHEKTHQEIVKFLSEQHKLDGWWCQMITNGYEQHIGRRKKHEMAGGFEVSVSKTFPNALPELFEAWNDSGTRAEWLEDADLQFSTVNINKNLRGPWVDGTTRINVDFYEKGPAKTQVVVQHVKIAEDESGQELKKYWQEMLGRLAEVLSS